MKNIYLTQQKQLLARYPTCKFLGQNKILQEVNLENCKVENCQIEAKVDLKDVNISKAIISSKKQKNKKISKNNFLSKKYYDFLLNFDKNLFDGVKIAIICANAHIGRCAKKLFESLHAEVKIYEISSPFESVKGQIPRLHSDIGFCIDENGEKIWAINSNGQILNGDEILYLLAWWMDNQNKLFGEVVGTNLTNLGVENKLRALKLLLRRVSLEEFTKTCSEKSFVLGATQSGNIVIKWNGEVYGAMLAMRALASIYLENKNIWLRVKENKYVQVVKTIPNLGQIDTKLIKTFVDFYMLKLKNQGRVEIWQRQNDLNIMVECLDKTTAAVLAIDIKKKIIKYTKNNIF